MRSRQLWKLLSGAALLVAGMVIGASAPASAESGGCVGDVVVPLDVRVLARPGLDLYEFPFSEPLPPGVWSVQVVSNDGYEGRSATNQTQEQWMISLWGHDTLGPTTDIPDGVEAASVIDDLGTVTTTSGIAGVTVTHAIPSSPWGHQSVNAVCVGFTLLGSPPESVTASVTADCAIPGIHVSVVNDGVASAPIEVELENPPYTKVEFWLDPGQGRRIDLVVPNGQYEVVVEVGEVHIHEDILQVACDVDPVPVPDPVPVAVPDPTPQPRLRPQPVARLIPSLGASLECSTSTVEVRIANTGTMNGSADLVLVRTGVIEVVELKAKSSTVVSVESPANAEGIVLEFLLIASDGQVLDAEVLVDCLDPARPTATLKTLCPSDTVEVRVLNRGGEPAGVDVFVEQLSLVAQRTVVGGGEVTIVIPFGEAIQIPVRVVTDAGVDLLRETVNVDCPRAAIDASLSVSCPSGELQVTLRNLGDADGVSRLIIDDGEPYGVTLEPGEEVVLVRRIDVATTTTVSVVDAFDEVVLSEVVEALVCGGDSDPGPEVSNPCPSGLSNGDGWTVVGAAALSESPCPGLSVRLVVDCVGYSVALVGSNGSADSRSMVVVVGDQAFVGDFALRPGEESTWELPDAAGERVVVTERGSTEALVDVVARCESGDGSGSARAAGMLIVLMSLVTVVVVRFDPWVRA